jgi:hypothetical protein
VIVNESGINRFTTGEHFVTLVAMKYAAMGIVPDVTDVDKAFDFAYDRDINLLYAEVQRLPMTTYSLMDADLYGYRGKVRA